MLAKKLSTIYIGLHNYVAYIKTSSGIKIRPPPVLAISMSILTLISTISLPLRWMQYWNLAKGFDHFTFCWENDMSAKLKRIKFINADLFCANHRVWLCWDCVAGVAGQPDTTIHGQTWPVEQQSGDHKGHLDRLKLGIIIEEIQRKAY